MIEVLLGIGPVLMLLVVSEYLWRNKLLRGERARKLIHVVAGILIAFWPWLMSFQTIKLLSLGMIIVVLLSRKFKIFKGVHGIHRHTVGDILFPISVGIVAYVAPTDWIFAVAMLHLGLADGLAAVVGDRLGKKNRYKIFGEFKSVAGSLTFLTFSILIMIGLTIISPVDFKDFYWTLIILLPLTTTCVENLSVKGTDNVFVPLLVAVMLNQVAQMSLLLY